ncbi:hypothetical protein GALL_424950 [mine drainage metagenome]|uniref:DUF2442 domain-containing protein n=1 Tax=mine drainage metagenome TaxID=410659 RepID=A0A1J5Q748_9ZZZZ
MRGQAISQENFPAGVIRPRSPWRVESVDVVGPYRLHVRFIDGTEGTVDMESLVRSPGAGVFAALVDLDVFERVGLQYGAVTWPGEIDLAPDAMYQAVRATGEWCPT